MFGDDTLAGNIKHLEHGIILKRNYPTKIKLAYEMQLKDKEVFKKKSKTEKTVFRFRNRFKTEKNRLFGSSFSFKNRKPN
jgi:hypothetical protein